MTRRGREGDEYMLYGMRSARGDETVVRDSEMTTLAGLNGSGVLTPILGDVEELRVDHGVSVVPPDYYHFRSGMLPSLHPSIPSFLDYKGFCDASSPSLALPRMEHPPSSIFDLWQKLLPKRGEEGDISLYGRPQA